MSNYETHYSIASKAGGAVAVVFGLTTLVTTFDLVWTLFAVLVGYYATVVGGIAPDIDQSQPFRTFRFASVPYRKFTRLLGFATVLTALFLFVKYNPQDSTIEGTFLSLVGLVGVLMSIRLLPDLLHSVMPKHRGLLHKFRFWLIVSVVVGVLLHVLLRGRGYPLFVHTYLPVILATGAAMGVVTHISTDLVSSFVKTDVRPRLPWTPRRLPPLLDLPILILIFFSRRTPWSIRFLVIGVLAYFLLPVDIIPDYLLGLGYGDDLALYWILRQHIYVGYKEGLSVGETLERELVVFTRVIVPAIILALAVAVGFVVYIL